MVPAAGLRADGRDSALQAARMLASSGYWVRIGEVAAEPSASPYPRHFYGAIFHFDGHLWLYSEYEGTIRLSRGRPGDPERRIDELPRLLPRARRGLLGAGSFIEPALESRFENPPKLKNGCFIESLHQLEKLVQEVPSQIRAAQLLSLFLRRDGEVFGHTVLTYRTASGWRFWDPEYPQAGDRTLRGWTAFGRARAIKKDRDRREDVLRHPERASGKLIAAALTRLVPSPRVPPDSAAAD